MDNFNAVNAGVFAATVTSLPVSPVNGQDAYYLADATNGIVWHFKYRTASASASKWEFVGGQALHSAVATNQGGVIGASYVDLATSGPAVTLALAGDYWVELGATATTDAPGQAVMSFNIGATAAVDANSLTIVAFARTDASPGPDRNRRTRVRLTGVAAGTTLTAKYRATAAVTTNFADRMMAVTPIRVT
jgi:hypothetical protein